MPILRQSGYRRADKPAQSTCSFSEARIELLPNRGILHANDGDHCNNATKTMCGITTLHNPAMLNQRACLAQSFLPSGPSLKKWQSRRGLHRFEQNQVLPENFS
jgi:hypothetical protein